MLIDFFPHLLTVHINLALCVASPRLPLLLLARALFESRHAAKAASIDIGRIENQRYRVRADLVLSNERDGLFPPELSFESSAKAQKRLESVELLP